MVAGTVNHSALPGVREAQGTLLRAIFNHPNFDAEGDRMYGKLFYVFEETVAVNDALELAHLGEDADGSIREALTRSVQNNTLVSANDPDGKLLKEARERYREKAPTPDAIEDIDLGSDVRDGAGAVRDAARKVLGE